MEAGEDHEDCQVKGLEEEETETAVLEQSEDEKEEGKTPDDCQDEVEIIPVEEEVDLSLKEETCTDLAEDKAGNKNERKRN